MRKLVVALSVLVASLALASPAWAPYHEPPSEGPEVQPDRDPTPERPPDVKPPDEPVRPQGICQRLPEVCNPDLGGGVVVDDLCSRYPENCNQPPRNPCEVFPGICDEDLSPQVCERFPKLCELICEVRPQICPPGTATTATDPGTDTGTTPGTSPTATAATDGGGAKEEEEDDDPSGPLAFTGLDTWLVLLIGAVLLAGGLGARQLLKQG